MIQFKTTSTTAFERGIDPLFRILTPEQAVQIANCHADEPLQQRIEELASKCNEGELSEEELAEYVEMWQGKMRRLEAHGEELKLAPFFNINALSIVMAGNAKEYFDLWEGDRDTMEVAKSYEELLSKV